ncbi:MarC family protein [Francisellaceae bacterium CB52]|jgi:multiple antibiotic resistance protein
MTEIFLKHLLGLFIIINPISKVFIFHQMASNLDDKARFKNAIIASITIAIFMLLAVWFGLDFLSVFGISLDDFKVAGGIIIFYNGFTLLYEGKIKVGGSENDFAIVPFSFPITIGAGALSIIIIFSADYGDPIYKFYQSIEVFIMTGFIGLLLVFSKKMISVLPNSSVEIINKLMAVVLMSIAVGMIKSGVLD